MRDSYGICNEFSCIILQVEVSSLAGESQSYQQQVSKLFLVPQSRHATGTSDV